MAWTWVQSRGELLRDGVMVARGYSGRGDGRNNPDMQGVRATGPIPRGRWTIGAARNHPKLGPLTIALDKVDGQPGDDIDAVTRRSAFRIHGNNRANDASHGCIILDRWVRELIDKSDDRQLEVVR